MLALDPAQIRDCVYSGVSIRAVLPASAGEVIFVAFRAERVSWLDPVDARCDIDGWVINGNAAPVEDDLPLHFAREDAHVAACQQLAEWQASPPPRLTVVARAEPAYIGLIDPDTRMSVGVGRQRAARVDA